MTSASRRPRSDPGVGVACGRPWPTPWPGPARRPHADSANDLFAVGADLRPEPAEVIDLAVQAPHLAYLARVAAGVEGTLGDDGTYEADVIVFDGPRPGR